MPKSRLSTRRRLLDTARDLFARQGITQTTTRQIADAAGVNEVTLFRHFGTKQGLLLAVFAELDIFSGVGILQLGRNGSSQQALLQYFSNCFEALTNNPELVRSVVGEAGLYTDAHRQALGDGFVYATRQLAQNLARVASANTDPQTLAQAAGILHLLILGAAVMQVTARLPALDPESQEEQVAQWLQWSVAFWLRGVDQPLRSEA